MLAQFGLAKGIGGAAGKTETSEDHWKTIDSLKPWAGWSSVSLRQRSGSPARYSTGSGALRVFFFFFLRGSPRYYIGANRTLPSTHAIGYVGKPVRVGARRALPQEDNAIPKRSASMKAYHRKATPSDGRVPSTRG